MITISMFRRNPDGSIREKVSKTGNGAEVASFWIRGGNTSKQLNASVAGARQIGAMIRQQRAAMELSENEE